MKKFQLKNDDELICLLKNGDELSFTEIYDRYWDKLYFIAYKLLKDTSAAEEIVQEVFLTLWKKRESLSIKSIAPYLAAMTRYAVYRHAAQIKNSKRQENLLGILNVETILEIDINQKILLEIITNMSNKLPEKCRLVFQYNKLQDMSLAEVAENLNISPKTAEGHLTKALRVIRANFDGPMSDLLLFTLVIRLFIR